MHMCLTHMCIICYIYVKCYIYTYAYALVNVRVYVLVYRWWKKSEAHRGVKAEEADEKERGRRGR